MQFNAINIKYKCVWYVSKEGGLEENCTKMLIALCVNYFYIFASLQ